MGRENVMEVKFYDTVNDELCLSRACVILEVGLKSASENSGSLL